MIIEGSGSRAGSRSIPLTSGSGSESGRPKNTWIRIRIRIRNTAFCKVSGPLEPKVKSRIRMQKSRIWIVHLGFKVEQNDRQSLKERFSELFVMLRVSSSVLSQDRVRTWTSNKVTDSEMRKVQVGFRSQRGAGRIQQPKRYSWDSEIQLVCIWFRSQCCGSSISRESGYGCKILMTKNCFKKLLKQKFLFFW